MALDTVRNEAYGRALRSVIRPDSVVLDLGAGTGIHGLMAARLGARRVYLVEPEDILTVAEEIAQSNGLSDRMTFLQGRIEDVDVPERVDVIVSVLTGNFLLTEDLLGALFHARDRVLKPGGVLIPAAATMEAAPVSAEAVHAQAIAAWSVPQQGIDMGGARAYAANSIFYRSDPLRNVPMLAAPRVLHRIDFAQATDEPVRVQATYDISVSGVCHGWVGWCNMQLGDEWLSTSPHAAAMHWSQAFLPLDPPLAVECGDRVTFGLSRAPHGDWTWTVEAPAGTRRHSTLLEMPLTAGHVRQATVDYAPSLNPAGKAAMYVLAHCDGRQSINEIADGLQHAFPGRYGSRDEAIRFVHGVVRHHS